MIADRIGRRGQLAIMRVLIAIFSFIGPILIGAGYTGQDAFVIIGFGVLGLSFGQATGSISSRFGRGYRYTGAAFTSDLALAGRRGLRATGGAQPVQPLRLAIRRLLPALGCHLHAGGAGIQQGTGTARLIPTGEQKQARLQMLGGLLLAGTKRAPV